MIHAGVYYAPGSLKAQFCKAGVTATINFCDQHSIDYEQCGKLLVATNSQEYQRILALYQRCQANGLNAELLDKQQLKQQETNIIGIGAIFSTTGIVDYAQICDKMAAIFIENGG